MIRSRLPATPALCLVLLACSDGTTGPGADGTPFLRVSIDGVPWVPDTSNGVLFGTTPQIGTLNLFGVRSLGAKEEIVTLSIQGFPRTGTITLAGSSSAAVGAYTILDTGDSTFPPPTTAFLSTALAPGQLRITGLSPMDSVVAGTFSFVAVTTPDTAPHHAITGLFRIRYTFQQIYVPVTP